MRRSWRVSPSPLDVGGGSSWLSSAQANRCDKSDCGVVALQDRKSSCRTDSLHLLLEETIAVRMFASRECPCRFHWSSFDAKVEADFCSTTSGISSKPTKGGTSMRFMMIVKASKDSEAGMMPSEELLSAMGKYNEELMKAGVLLDLSGLQPSSKGARIKFSGSKKTV